MTMSIMIQGTGSNVGKSMLVAGLARALHKRGLSVAPFKPQNMSNNAAVTSDGGEIGRAQALQALACHIPPHTDMNPVLLKPETSTGSQVIVQGQRLATVKAADYAALKPKLLPRVLESYNRLAQSADIVLVEGAGSPAEINLRKGDIANIGFAEAARVPIILAGDIDRGGVIAQLVGTHAVLPKTDRDLIKGFLVNKFRGDPRLFEGGYETIKNRTHWRGLGVIPWFAPAHLLPAEDSADIKSGGTGAFKIVVPQLARIANFDDLDPLKTETELEVVMLPPGTPIPGDADLIILPGSKSTTGDLAFMREQGWDIDIAAHVRRGGHVLGICGGYQMLGKTICDPGGIEGPPGTVAGLGLLDVTTTMTPQKTLTQVTGTAFDDQTPVKGYEIHIGTTTGPDCQNGWLHVGAQPLSAQNARGTVSGTYVHGLFSGDAFRAKFLRQFGLAPASRSYDATVDETLDALSQHLEDHLDIDAVLKIAKTGV